MAMGLIVVGMGPPPVLAVAATGLLGFGFAFPWSSVVSAALRQTPERERGSAVGVISAFYDLFVGLSSFAAGAVATHFGYSAAFLMAVLGLGAAAITGRFVFPDKDTPVVDVAAQVLDVTP